MHLIYRSLYIVVDICTSRCNHIEAQDPAPTLGSYRLMGSRQGGSPGPKVHLARRAQRRLLSSSLFSLPHPVISERERGLRLSSTKAVLVLRLWTTLAVRAGPGCWGCTDTLLFPPQPPHHSGFLLGPQVSGCGPGRKAGKIRAAGCHGHPPLSEVFLEEQAFLRRVAGGKCVCVFLLLKLLPLNLEFLPFLKLSSDSPLRSLFLEPVVTKQPCPWDNTSALMGSSSCRTGGGQGRASVAQPGQG